KPSASVANIRGGSHAVIFDTDSMPGPRSTFTATGFPSRSSNTAGTNQDDIPGPVAMACQTSSGVPGSSTSNWTDRRPEASFVTLMMAPRNRIFAAKGAPRPPGDESRNANVARENAPGGEDFNDPARQPANVLASAYLVPHSTADLFSPYLSFFSRFPS